MPHTKPEDVITDGLVEPSGLAIDRENRLLYVSDIALDQVLVYDADSFKLKRKMGTTGHKHELTTPGDFAKPHWLAVDAEGNLYVCDTLNNRIEIFDADGKFISAFGKTATVRDTSRVPRAWRSMAMATSGSPMACRTGCRCSIRKLSCSSPLVATGCFRGSSRDWSASPLDKNNRVFTSEIYPGRVQQFRYVTDAEAEKLQKEREEQRMKKAGAAQKEVTPIAAPTARPPLLPATNLKVFVIPNEVRDPYSRHIIAGG